MGSVAIVLHGPRLPLMRRKRAVPSAAQERTGHEEGITAMTIHKI